MINEITFDVLLSANSKKEVGIHPLPVIHSFRDALNNYRIIKKKFPKSKMSLVTEEICKECGHLKKVWTTMNIKNLKLIYNKMKGKLK